MKNLASFLLFLFLPIMATIGLIAGGLIIKIISIMYLIFYGVVLYKDSSPSRIFSLLIMILTICIMLYPNSRYV